MCVVPGGNDVHVRRIVIVRHAKSDWSDGSLTDHDRPLAPRGIRALDRMSDHLARISPPGVVLCSSARRTLDTLSGVRAALPGDIEVSVENDLYGADAWSLVERLRTIDDDVESVMLVGHNPGLHDLVTSLVGDVGAGRDPVAWERLVAKFPTGAIATLSFRVGWADIEVGCADLDDFFTPRHPRV